MKTHVKTTMMKTLPSGTSPSGIVQTLREQLRGIELAGRAAGRPPPISSGCEALDRLLPTRGLVSGQLIEWLVEQPGSGAGTLAMVVAWQACGCDGRVLVVADRARHFYPPAAAAWGIDLKQLIVLRAQSERDELWALVQSLRCPGVAAIWAPLDRLDQRSFRRLQLAAEEGGGLGLLLRPASVRGKPTWSDIQLLVQPRPSPRAPFGESSASRGRRLRVELVRCRGGEAGQGAVELEMDEVTGIIREAAATRQAIVSNHETHSRYLAAQLAHSAPGRRSARA